jgi:26S proteasome regulatory subunit N7
MPRKAKKSNKGGKKKAAASPKKKEEVEDVAMAPAEEKGEEKVEVEEWEEDEEDGHVEEDTSQDPLVTLTNLRFLLTLPEELVSLKQRKAVVAQLTDYAKTNVMGPFYKDLCSTFDIPLDAKLLKDMEATNKTELAELEQRIKDATDNLGDTEVREAVVAVANYHAHIGDKANSLKWYDQAMEKTVGTGEKINLMFAQIHVSMLHGDKPLLKTLIEATAAMVEKGGDWERRNLLGVYQSMHQITTRDFKSAAEGLLDAIATFTCYRLCEYNKFIFYTVLMSMVSLDRVTLRTKVVKAPEILSVIRDVPHLKPFLMALYECRYADFFKALSDIAPYIKRDPSLNAHCGFFLREIRIAAYSQFLESYSSVTLESMARAFGVTVAFLDEEVSRFISAGRLNCKIDKVGGNVETNRPDKRNTQYAATIKEGDLLLNRIQKLTKLINY